jgi:hypothetical protein
MLFRKNNVFHTKLVISIFLYFTLIIGFFLDEDSLGGAIQDYNYHLPIAFAFKNNISDTLLVFGSNEMMARNSPLFYIILGVILSFFKNIDLNIIRLANTHVILIIIIFFYKSLKIKYYYVKKEILYLISATLFLSPTLRSLSIWPYPLIYGILFFTISVYFFLKFEKLKNNNYKYALLNILFLAISSYFTPNFCIFSIFFFFKFLQKYKLTIKTFTLVLLNFLLAAPAMLFLIKKKFYFFNYDVANITFLEKINIANKIILISTIIFFHLLPFLLTNIKKINHSRKKFIFIIFIYFTSLIFFNFPKEYNGGGGMLFHLSNILTENNSFLFIFFFISLIFVSEIMQRSYWNYLLIILLIGYNLQFSIYHKYFDPLILIIFLLLIVGVMNKSYFKYKNVLYFYIFQIFFLILSLSRHFISNVKI